MQEIFIDRNEELLRIAVKKHGILQELLFQKSQEPYLEEIYCGTVENIVPAIKSAFIDIGKNKNVYMYMDKKFGNSNLKKGQELLVQIVKEDIGKKGAKVINSISIPGKYSVLKFSGNGVEFSRKIKDCNLKEQISSSLNIPENIGIMIRTAAENTSIDIIQSEIDQLHKIYVDILGKSRYSLKTGIIFDNGGLIGKVLRDEIDETDFKIYVDNLKDYDNIHVLLRTYGYNECHVEIYRGERNLFSYYDIERHILDLRKNRVYLKCGGYIVIDRTEAMYVIDVNSGKNVKQNSMNRTVFITNSQAAEEIARQIKLRNMSGIIVIDFIDMFSTEDKCKVMSILERSFLRDKNKTVVYPFTELNLVQIARKRTGRSISEYLEENCRYCSGRGNRIRFEYISMLIKNEVSKIILESNVKHIHIEVGNTYKDEIENYGGNFLWSSCDRNDVSIYLTFVPGDYFKVQPVIFINHIENLKKFKIN